MVIRTTTGIIQFQSTLPQGERHENGMHHPCVTLISIHAPARGATAFHSDFRIGNQFQSTLPQGERLDTVIGDFTPITISIHAPARGATGAGRRTGKTAADFNPRSRKGSDITYIHISHAFTIISIHAPARGATTEAFAMAQGFKISIHAPARGAPQQPTMPTHQQP